MNTNEKGDIGLTKVIANLVEYNYRVSLPISEHLAYDLIAENINGKLFKIQVKYRTLSTTGSLIIELQKNRYSSKELKNVVTDLDAFDYYAFYCPDNTLIYYISTKRIIEIGNKTAITLRVTAPSNGQITNIHFAKDYLELPGEISKLDLPIKKLIKSISCPYCNKDSYNSTSKKSGKFETWKSVRGHTSGCEDNTGEYFIDINIGPIFYNDLINLVDEEYNILYKDAYTMKSKVKESFKDKGLI